MTIFWAIVAALMAGSALGFMAAAWYDAAADAVHAALGRRDTAVRAASLLPAWLLFRPA